MSPSGAPEATPALAKRMSRCPFVSRTVAKTRSRSEILDTSLTTPCAFRPSCATAASSSPFLRPVTKTNAPSATKRLAVARPMPLLPPVTSATLPSSFPITCLLSSCSPQQQWGLERCPRRPARARAGLQGDASRLDRLSAAQVDDRDVHRAPGAGVDRVNQPALRREPAVAPFAEGDQHRQEVERLGRRQVEVPRGVVLVGAPLEQPPSAEGLQTARQRRRLDRQPRLQLLECPRPLEHFPQDEQHPPLAHLFGGTGNRAVHLREACAFHCEEISTRLA